MVFILFFFSNVLLARCPGYLYGDQIIGSIQGKRSNLNLYVKNKNGSWAKSLIQIDPMFRKNKLRFFEHNPPDYKWHETELRYTDRVSLRTEDFGVHKGESSLPCSAKKSLQVKSKEGKFGYLVFCDQKKQNYSSLLNYDQKNSCLLYTSPSPRDRG